MMTINFGLFKITASRGAVLTFAISALSLVLNGFFALRVIGGF